MKMDHISYHCLCLEFCIDHPLLLSRVKHLQVLKGHLIPVELQGIISCGVLVCLGDMYLILFASSGPIVAAGPLFFLESSLHLCQPFLAE
jgi:hypothetical protein